MRIYDPRLGRFLSVDPLQKSYPELTPYQFANNSPIANIDLDGLENYWYNYAWDKSKGFTLLSHGKQTNEPTWWEVNISMHPDPAKFSGKPIVGVSYSYDVNGKSFSSVGGMVKAGLSGGLDNTSEDKFNEVISTGAIIIAAEITENAMENSAAGHSLDAFIAGGELMSAEKLLKNPTKGETEVINKPTERVHGGTPEASTSNTAIKPTVNYEGKAYEVNATAPYKRPSNATTVKQRKAVNQPGATCATCGTSQGPFIADHITPLGIEHISTGSVDKKNMTSIKVVQSQCQGCSLDQSAKVRKASMQANEIIKQNLNGTTNQ